MSAYVVHADTIDYLVTAARLWRLAADGYLPHEARNLTDSELGNVLLSENVRSVNARYSEQDEAPAYEYRLVRFDAIDAVTVLKSVQCVNYQSCETDDWTGHARVSRAEGDRSRRDRPICAGTVMRPGGGFGRLIASV